MTPKQVTKNKRLIKKILNHFNCVLCGISANVLILKGICNRCGILGSLGERLKQCLVRIFCRNRFGIFAQNALNRLEVQIKFFAIAREPLCSARLINIILFLSTPFSIAVSFGVALQDTCTRQVASSILRDGRESSSTWMTLFTASLWTSGMNSHQRKAFPRKNPLPTLWKPISTAIICHT